MEHSHTRMYGLQTFFTPYLVLMTAQNFRLIPNLFVCLFVLRNVILFLPYFQTMTSTYDRAVIV